MSGAMVPGRRITVNLILSHVGAFVLVPTLARNVSMVNVKPELLFVKAVCTIMELAGTSIPIITNGQMVHNLTAGLVLPPLPALLLPQDHNL